MKPTLLTVFAAVVAGVCFSLNADAQELEGTIYLNEDARVLTIRGDVGRDVCRVGLNRDGDKIEVRLWVFNDLDSSEVDDYDYERYDLTEIDRIHFFGYEGKDSFINNTDRDCLADGGPGDDSLTGGSGSDYLVGGRGMDFVSGREGDDFLFPGHDSEYTGDFYEYGALGGSGRDYFFREILSSSRFYQLKSSWIYGSDYSADEDRWSDY